MTDQSRIDAEWVTLNAFRGFIQIASKGDMSKATYDNALEFGGELYPELLGRDASILRRSRESDMAKEYRQRARIRSIKEGIEISPLAMLETDAQEIKELLDIASSSEKGREKVDQLKRKYKLLLSVRDELNLKSHSENELIFRDVHQVDRGLDEVSPEKSGRVFQLNDEKLLRIRIFHPEQIEYITGADIVYEKHIPNQSKASIIAVQYKIWEDKKLYMSDQRMHKQLRRLRGFICDNSICSREMNQNSYRFPFCSAFLRPTDKLQNVDQKFLSTGEHIPICKIDTCTIKGKRGGDVITYDSIRDASLSSDIFEYLFNKGKIGSAPMTYAEIDELYFKHQILLSNESVIIHAVELS